MRIPGPWLAKFTQWYLRLFEVLDRRQQFIEKMHKTHGSVVQLAPRTISINSIKGLQEVYSVTRKFDRPPLPMFYAYGSENLVSTVDAHLHQERRKPMRRLYARRSIDSEEMQDLFRRKAKDLAQYCSREAQISRPMDAKLTLQLMTAEIMSKVVYGEKFALALLSDEKQRSRMAANIKSQDERLISLSGAMSAWFPYFVLSLRRWNLAPYPLNGALSKDLLMYEVGTAALDCTIRASNQEQSSEDPSLMDVLVTNHAQQLTPEKKKYILSECHDHFWAGVTTTSDALLALMFQLSLPKNRHRQQRLRQNLANGSSQSGASDIKFVDCVIKESLRMHPPVIGSLDRITTSAVTVDGFDIPTGTEVGAQAYSLHRRADVFPSPNEWQPERWELDSGSEGQRSMNRHLFAFGNGPRMCIGMNMAYSIMRHAVASVYRNFRMTLPEEFVAGTADSPDVQEEKMKKWIRAKECPIQFEVLEKGEVSTH